MFMRENKGLCAFKYVRDGLGPGPWEIKCVCAHRGRLRNNSVHGKGFGVTQIISSAEARRRDGLRAFETRLAPGKRCEEAGV